MLWFYVTFVTGQVDQNLNICPRLNKNDNGLSNE